MAEDLSRRITVRVTPGARKARIEPGVGEDGAPLYLVYVTEKAQDGKANAAVIRALAKHLGVRKSDLSLRLGARHRVKVIDILG